MASEDELAMKLGLPDSLHHVLNHLAVEVVLGLIDNERWAWLGQEYSHQGRRLPARGCDVEVNEIAFSGLILKH